jgi:hypothetical protein
MTALQQLCHKNVMIQTRHGFNSVGRNISAVNNIKKQHNNRIKRPRTFPNVT